MKRYTWVYTVSENLQQNRSYGLSVFTDEISFYEAMNFSKTIADFRKLWYNKYAI